eukprot:gene22590-28725_t
MRNTEIGGTALANDDNTLDLDKSTGFPGLYSFLNTSTKPHTCGLASKNPSGNSVPICITMLHGSPVISLTPGYVVDMTDSSSMKGITVNFHIDKGWSCNVPSHRSNCTPVAANEKFGAILNCK